MLTRARFCPFPERYPVVNLCSGSIVYYYTHVIKKETSKLSLTQIKSESIIMKIIQFSAHNAKTKHGFVSYLYTQLKTYAREQQRDNIPERHR